MAGFFSILAAVWTKSSFAITLLGFSEGWTRKIVWFILISVNVVLGLNATLQWVQCWPIDKLWLGGPGVCWLGFARVRAYNTFVAGEYAYNVRTASRPLLTLSAQLIRAPRT
jgi:hypothetical protein